MNGFINLLKPPGMSSAQAVGSVKRILGIKKIGHAGTLDPLASGVIPIMVGRACKLFDYIQNHQKEYIFEIAFGKETNTLDAEGQIVSTTEKIPTMQEILAIIPQFIGEIQQAPPMYSAIKKDGKPLYMIARKGESLDIPLRNTEVFALQALQEIQNGKILFYVKCKSGFYVRSLCRDLAYTLASKAYMSLLIRRSVANFQLSNALSIQELLEKVEKQQMDFILPMDFPLENYPKVNVSEKDRWDLRNGKKIAVLSEDNLYRVYERNCFLGLGKVQEQKMKMQTLLEL